MTMFQDLKDSAWIHAYAKTTAFLKGGAGDTVDLGLLTSSLERSFQTVYRAVAFDIDGTLTRGKTPEIDPAMAQSVARLLHRGVPVFLVTGRGRQSARDAAREIRSAADISPPYLRRLRCITHNGVYLLETPAVSDDDLFLSEETPLSDEIPDLAHWTKAVDRIIDDSGVPASAVDVTQEPNSIRVAFTDVAIRAELEQRLQPLISEIQARYGVGYLTRGAYAEKVCLDISTTTKRSALAFVADIIGVSPEMILRIGDQGREGGNDHDLLDSSAGFSVDELSLSATGCFPVLSGELTVALGGVEATNRLLSELIYLFPPLSLNPTEIARRSYALRQFERSAAMRSRKETSGWANKLHARLASVLHEQDSDSWEWLELADVFDPFSGGVRFREWELDSLIPKHPARTLLGFDNLAVAERRPLWTMYTDTGILARGSGYYYGITHGRSLSAFKSYLNPCIEFLTVALNAVHHLAQERPDLTRFKVVLAIQDNVRNMLLNYFSASMLADEGQVPDYALAVFIYRNLLLPHTGHYYRFLTMEGLGWNQSLEEYAILLQTVQKTLPVVAASVETKCLGDDDVDFFKWRECDHFLQNIAAVTAGLSDFQTVGELSGVRRFVAAGLAHGGNELPALFEVIGEPIGLHFSTALIRVSHYGLDEARELIRSGQHQELLNALVSGNALCWLTDPVSELKGDPVLLLDDNCTTCISLQLARDFFVLIGGDVIGAIVVRYPGSNRAAHMAIPGHGFPDPDILMSYVRGLVAPSPYTRLVRPGPDGREYEDETRMFDRARDRIHRYLVKNGTPPPRG